MEGWGRADRFRYDEIHFSRVVVTAPVLRAVTIPQVRERLRLGVNDTDDDINNMIDSAQLWWEGVTMQSLMPQTVDLLLDGFPVHDKEMPLFYAPVRTLDTVKYTDLKGVTQTWPKAKFLYSLKSGMGRMRPIDTERWPDTKRNIFDAVAVRMHVGYATADAVPADIKDAIMLMVGARYQYREEVVTLSGQSSINNLPMGALAIAQRYRLQWVEQTVR